MSFNFLTENKYSSYNGDNNNGKKEIEDYSKLKIMNGNINHEASNGKLCNVSNEISSQFEAACNAIKNLPKEGHHRRKIRVKGKMYLITLF